MTDLLNSEDVQAFKDAMRDVTDTFHKYPVTLERESGNTDLLCGRKLITNDFKARETGEEIDEAYEIAFNRDYIRDEGLVDGDDMLLIGFDDRFLIDEKRYHIASIDERSFRDEKIFVVFEVVR